MGLRAHAIHLIYGAASAALFLIVLASGLDLFMLLPTLPLLVLALTSARAQEGALAMLHAGGFGFILLLVLAPASGGQLALVYLAICAAPALLVLPALLPNGRKSIGAALTDVAIYTGLLVVLLLVHYAPQGGLKAVLIANLNAGFAELPAQMQGQMEGTLLTTLERSLPLVLGFTGWWFTLLLYLHAWLATHIAFRGANEGLRPSLALVPFPLPWWLLPLAAGLAGLSLMGPENLAFGASVLLLVALLPFFLLGMAIILEKTRDMPGRGVLLFLLYFLSFAIMVPIPFVIGLGIYQCMARNKPQK